MIKLLILSLISTICAANSMLFEVDSFDLKREVGQEFLAGSAYARDIYIKYDAVEFDLAQDGELFLVDAALYNNKFNFRKDNLNLTTYIPQIDEIDFLDFIYANQALIEFTETGFNANGPQLSIGAASFLFDIRNVQINCASNGFTFRLDQICLKNMLINPSKGSEFAKVEIKQESQDTSFINILGKKVLFTDDRINIDAQSISGNILNSEIGLKAINVDCFKDSELKSFNLDLIFAGCLEESLIAGSEIRLLREGRPFEIYDGVVYFNENHVGVEADKLLAETQKGLFTFFDIEAKCLKTINNKRMISADAFYLGCLKSSYFKINKINEDQIEKDSNRISDLNIHVTDGEFKLNAKLRALFTLHFRASGTLNINETQREVRVQVAKAKVAGMTATKMVLKFVMKFINSDSVSLENDTIIIKY